MAERTKSGYPAPSFFLDLAQAEVRNSLLVAELYRTRGSIHIDAPPLWFIAEQFIRVVTTKARRRLEHVLVALGEDRLYLFEMKFRVSGWIVHRLIGAWPRANVSCQASSEERFALKLGLPGEEGVMRLFPRWLSDDAARILHLLTAGKPRPS